MSRYNSTFFEGINIFGCKTENQISNTSEVSMESMSSLSRHSLMNTWAI